MRPTPAKAESIEFACIAISDEDAIDPPAAVMYLPLPRPLAGLSDVAVSLLYSNDSGLDRHEDGFRPITHIELFGDVIQVIPDRELAYLEGIRHFLIGKSLCDQFEDLALTVA